MFFTPAPTTLGRRCSRTTACRDERHETGTGTETAWTGAALRRRVDWSEAVPCPQGVSWQRQVHSRTPRRSPGTVRARLAFSSAGARGPALPGPRECEASWPRSLAPRHRCMGSSRLCGCSCLVRWSARCSAGRSTCDGSAAAAAGGGWRWLAASPLLFSAVLFSNGLDFSGLLEDGIGGGAIGVPAVGMLGGFAISGRGPLVGRLLCGALALSSVPVWVLTAADISPSLDATTASGAWMAVYCWTFLAVLALASSIPHRPCLP